MAKFMMPDCEERLELSRRRINEIARTGAGEDGIMRRYRPFFDFYAKKITKILDTILPEENGTYDWISVKKLDQYFRTSEKKLHQDNQEFFRELLPKNYKTCFANPDYAEKIFEINGKGIAFLAAELSYLPQLVMDLRADDILILMELFLEIYGLFSDQNTPSEKCVSEAISYYAYDYVEMLTEERTEEILIPGKNAAMRIIEEENLLDMSYLYRYGEYVSEDDLELSRFYAKLSVKEIGEMAETFTKGFRRGFETMRVVFDDKKTVNIRYHIGQERMVKEAVRQFRNMGLEPILCRYAISRINRKSVIKQGFEGTPVNQQFEYDHRQDDALFLTAKYVDRKVNAVKRAYKLYEEEAWAYAGPAVIETFGEDTFSPVQKDSAASFSDSQQKMYVDLSAKNSAVVNTYIPGDHYSFTIIAYPLPAIGPDFEKIFYETVKLNNLDNSLYTKIQQCIIDCMDRADKVHIVGTNGNETDIRIQLRKLEAPEKETQFENCVADVNIPLGEVFTSPVLKGTNGTIHVSQVYLNGLLFKNLKIVLTDGCVSDYECGNYADPEMGRRYIGENILFNHTTLPMGEFAIGTNTTAYRMAKRFDILGKLPILIVEKTGPHFALGDTCYSHSEDKAVFNPDGKEIISRENDFSLLRNEDPEKAYFNCHTDITIPYEEIGAITCEYEDGTTIDIIRDGRFVLLGTEELNKALDE